MKKIIEFLNELDVNNNRVWFNANKDRYLECKAEFDRLVEQVIEHIGAFDTSIRALTPADCTYRIYRDTRFSTDKTPYKTHFGAFIAPGGKKSGFSGYYFQVGADSSGFPNGCALATGDYCCDLAVLRLLREDIADDDAQQFESAINAAQGFQLDTDLNLKRVPRGFSPDHPRAELLKLRNFCLFRNVTHEYFLQSDLPARLAHDFSLTTPFLNLINRAIQYAKEENL